MNCFWKNCAVSTRNGTGTSSIMGRIWPSVCLLKLLNFWNVLNYAFQMADKYGLDIKQIMLEKIRKNAEKYPVEKARGSAKKYTELAKSSR